MQQTSFGRGQGNCWSACIASILEIPIEKVPNFCVDCGDDWWEQTQKWVEGHGYGFIEMTVPTGSDLSLFGKSFWIASGKSPRGDFEHSVVYCGKSIRHDPHPDGTGLDGAPTRATFFTLMEGKDSDDKT